MFVPYLPQEIDWLLTPGNERAAGFEHVGNMTDQLILQWRQAQQRCLLCDGTSRCPFGGLIPVYEIDTENEIVIWRVTRCNSARAQRRHEIVSTLSQAAGIPACYQTIRLAVGDVEAPVLQQIVTYMRDGRKNLWIWGDQGVGKTRTAAAIAMAALRKAKTVRFYVVPTMLTQLKSSMGDGALFSALFTVITNAEVLVLDDAGTEVLTDWVGETLFSIFNARLNSNLATVVTSNIDPDSYAARFKGLSPRMFSRFRTFERIHMMGNDRRVII